MKKGNDPYDKYTVTRLIFVALIAIAGVLIASWSGVIFGIVMFFVGL